MAQQNYGAECGQAADIVRTLTPTRLKQSNSSTSIIKMQLTHDPCHEHPSQNNVDYGVDVKGSREVTPSRADTLQPKSVNKN